MIRNSSMRLMPIIACLLSVVAIVTITGCSSFPNLFGKPTSTPTSTPTLTPLPTLTPTLTITPSPTLPYTREERDELIGFCTALSYFFDAEDEFWSAWEFWEPNLDDANYEEEGDVAYIFYEWALELSGEASYLPRPRAVRQIHDLLFESRSKWSDSIYALSNHYYSGYTEDYDKHSSLWDDFIRLDNQALDLWEDVSAEYDIDPWMCK